MLFLVLKARQTDGITMGKMIYVIAIVNHVHRGDAIIYEDVPSQRQILPCTSNRSMSQRKRTTRANFVRESFLVLRYCPLCREEEKKIGEKIINK